MPINARGIGPCPQGRRSSDRRGALTSSSTERVGERRRCSPLDVGLLDDGGERLLGHRAPPDPPEMGWTAPDGIDVPECGLWNLYPGTVRHEHYHDRPRHRQGQLSGPRHQRGGPCRDQAQAAPQRGDRVLRGAARMHGGAGGVRVCPPLRRQGRRSLRDRIGGAAADGAAC